MRYIRFAKVQFCAAFLNITKKVREKIGGMEMRKVIFISVFSLLVLTFAFYGGEVNAQMGPGMMGPGYGMGPGMMGGGAYGGWYCPYSGQYIGPRGGYGMGPGMMGPGMMGPGMMGPGMMGPGMMGPGMMGGGMMGPGMMGPGYGGQYGPQYGPQYQQPRKPMEEKDAKAILENYIQSTRNPNLKLGKIKENDNYFEAEIVTKDNSLVDKILVDRFTGWMRSVY